MWFMCFFVRVWDYKMGFFPFFTNILFVRMDGITCALNNLKYDLDYLNLSRVEKDEDISRFYKLLQQCINLQRDIIDKKIRQVGILQGFKQKLLHILSLMKQNLSRVGVDFITEDYIEGNDCPVIFVANIYNLLYSLMGISQYHFHVCNYDKLLEDARDELDICCVKYYVCVEEDTIKMWKSLARLNAEMFTYKSNRLWRHQFVWWWKPIWKYR